MSFAAWLEQWARRTPQAPAVALGARVHHDYRSLADRVSRLAGGLLADGLRPGDHVALWMHNRVEYFEALLGCWHAGLVAVPMNVKLHPREAVHIVEHSEARLCLTTRGDADGLRQTGARVVDVPSPEYASLFAEPCARHPSADGDVAWLFYTSGTTGRPKGAMLTHGNLHAMCRCYFADVDQAAPWPAILHPAPLSHGSGLYALPFVERGGCQVVPASGGFDAQEVFDLCDAWPGAALFAAPTMVRRLTAAAPGREVPGLKAVIYGGAAMNTSDVEAFVDRFGPRLAQLYGQGESPMTITSIPASVYADRRHPRWRERVASAGTAQSEVEVRTVDPSGQPVAAEEVGEIVCRGACTMTGYWRDAEATTRALRDGWLWTGDLGRLDNEGYLTLCGRSKDLIISGGSNIYPREVEEVLAGDPSVAEVAVVGRADAEWGEVVVAFVVLRAGHSPAPDALDQRCLESIARFKRPRHYRFVDTLPKNAYGKVLKTQLREQA